MASEDQRWSAHHSLLHARKFQLARVYVIALAATLVLALPAAAQPDEAQVRRDCWADALRYCAKTIPVSVLLRRRDPNDGERAAIIVCMVEHKDQLRRKCTRHFW